MRELFSKLRFHIRIYTIWDIDIAGIVGISGMSGMGGRAPLQRQTL